MNLQNLTDEELGDKIELTTHTLSCSCGRPINQHEQYELLRAYWREEGRRIYGK